MSCELVVLEAGDLQQLSFLHQGTTRLKVVCFDLCHSVILLGANSGTIYVLDHETLTLKTQIPTGSGSVVQLSISNDESLVACALSDGIVKVFELEEWSGGGLGEAVVVSREHEGNVVSALAWEHTNAEVYIADTKGRVSVLYVIRSKTASLFRSSSVHLMTLESRVTQLDYNDGYLLVSTLTRSYICNTALETFAQVGTRLRQGEFGGCFCRVSAGGSSRSGDCSNLTRLTQRDFYESLEGTYNIEQFLPDMQGLSDCCEATEDVIASQTNSCKPDQMNTSHNKPYKSDQNYTKTCKQDSLTAGEQNCRIFCARPGTRIWEADHSGKVLVTHQLKNALKVPAANVLHIDGSFGEEELLEEIARWVENGEPGDHGKEDGDRRGKGEQIDTTAPLHPPVSVAFTKLLSYYNNYLLAISSYGLYVIDPSNSKVLMWINVSDSVTDIKVSGNSLIYQTGSGCIRNFMITTVDVAILFSHARKLPVECAYLCLQCKDLFSSSELLRRLGAKILTDLCNSIKNDMIKERLTKLQRSANLVKVKIKKDIPMKAGVTCIKNDKYEDEELKKCLNLALKSRQWNLPVSRWYSEPQLREYINKSSVLQRRVASVENSPQHQTQANLHGSSTTTCLYQGSSRTSLTQFSSEDTLQSLSEKSNSEAQSTSSSSEKKTTDRELDKKEKSSHLSRRCSQESNSVSSHRSLESSLELYEDPLFPSDDSNSSPDPDVMSKALYKTQMNPYVGHNFYSLAYTPIHPGSEAATLLQEMVENVTSNMVGSIASGTRSLTEKLRSVTPHVTPEVKHKKYPDGSLTISDTGTHNTGSPDTDGMEDYEHLVISSQKLKRKYRGSGITPLISKASSPFVDEAVRKNQELPGVVRNLHELVTSTIEKLINTNDKEETFNLLTYWLEVYCHTLQQIQVNKRLSPQASEEIPTDGPVSYSSLDSSMSQDSTGTSCDSLNWDSNDIGFEPSAMSSDILEQITEMFIQCLQAGVYAASLYNPKGISEHNKQDLQHPITPEEVKKRDVLYAQLITNDCGLLQYSHIINALDTFGYSYYILTWIALLEKITKDMDVIQSHTLPDIIPDLDFTRSQRLLFLYKIASVGSTKKLVTAASLITDPNVIQDLIFLLIYLAPSLEVERTSIRSKYVPELLLQYLNKHSLIKNLLQAYLDTWKLYPELQYDILSALLCEGDASLFSCECGMPKPGERHVAIEALTHTLLTHPLIDPMSMASLCRTLGFWQGFCTINLHYKLQTDQENFFYVLQLCDLQLLEDFMESTSPDQYSILLKALIRITCSDPDMMRCSKCHSFIKLSGKKETAVIKLSSNSKENKITTLPSDSNENRGYVNGTKENSAEKVLADEYCETKRNKQDEYYEKKEEEEDIGEGSFEDCGRVQSMRKVWESVVWQLLRLTGPSQTLNLLTEVQDDIPPGILTNKVYQWCILVSLAERRGKDAQLAVLYSLTNTKPKLYSFKVARSLYKQEVIELPEKIDDVENDTPVTDSTAPFNCTVSHNSATTYNNPSPRSKGNSTAPQNNSTAPENNSTALKNNSTALYTNSYSPSSIDISSLTLSLNNPHTHSSNSLTPRTTSSSPNPQRELSHDANIPGHHWGVATGLLGGLCQCCHLPLTTSALVVEGGITVFPCTHAFHTVCLSYCGPHCVTCAKERLHSRSDNLLTSGV